MDTTPSAKTRQVTLSLPPNFSAAAARRRRRARKRRATRLVTLFVAIVASLAIRRLCRSFEGDGELAAFLSEKIVGLACALLEVALLGPAGPFLARCWRALAAAIAALKLALPRVGNAAAAASASSVSESPGGALGVVDWRALSRDPRVFASVARTCVVAAHDALGAPLSFVVIVLLVTLWNGRRLSAIRARRCASNVSTRKIKAEGSRRLIMNIKSKKTAEWVGLPAWVVDGDVENVEWFNEVVRTVWPHVGAAAAQKIRSYIEPLLDHDKPKGISSMTFDEFELGSNAPRVDHVQMIPPDEPHELQAQAKITWKGNPNVVFKVEGPRIYGGLSPVKLVVTDLVIVCTVKVTLSHLMKEIPLVGGVQITMTDDPSIQYGIRAKAAPGMGEMNLDSIPGLKKGLTSFLMKMLRNSLVFPQAIKKVIAKDHTPQTVRAIEDALEVSPVGKLHVTVRGAKGLKNTEFMGTSDPYASVGLGTRRTPPEDKKCQKTHTIMNTLSPRWEKSFELDVRSTELQCLWIRVFDDDGKYGNDDFMGAVVVPLQNIPDSRVVDRPAEEMKSMAELSGGVFKNKRGTLEVSLKYIPDEFNAGKDDDATDSEDEFVRAGLSGVPAATKKPMFNRKNRRWKKKNHVLSSFQWNVGKLLGLRRPSTEMLHVHMTRDDGQLNHLSDSKLKHITSVVQPILSSMGGMPMWAVDPSWSRVDFANEFALTIWPYANGIVRREVNSMNVNVLPTMLPGIAWTKLSANLGAIPPTLQAVRVFKLGHGELIFEWSIVIAGDAQGSMRAGLKPLPFCRFETVLSEVQIKCVIRTRAHPLIPRFPIVGGVTVGILGATPKWDLSLAVKVPFLPKIDVAAIPGMAFVKHALISKWIPRWPFTYDLPVLNFAHPAVRQLCASVGNNTSAQHVLTIRIKGAKNLAAADKDGFSDPYAVLVMAGEAFYADRRRVTDVKSNTLNPRWDEEFSWTMNVSDDTRVCMIGVFDSDKKSRARVPTPEEVEEKMQPVKHLLEYSTQLATRYQFGGRIPWSRFIQRKVDRKRSARERRKAAKEREKQGLPPLPTRPVKLGVAGKLKKARTEDIQRRAALEPPVPPRVKTEEQLEKEAKKKAKAEKKRVKAEKKAIKLAKSRKKLLPPVPKAKFDGSRVMSDLELLVTGQAVTMDNDLLGICFVDFSKILRPGECATRWFPLTAVPGEDGDFVAFDSDDSDDDSELGVGSLAARRVKGAGRKVAGGVRKVKSVAGGVRSAAGGVLERARTRKRGRTPAAPHSPSPTRSPSSPSGALLDRVVKDVGAKSPEHGGGVASILFNSSSKNSQSSRAKIRARGKGKADASAASEVELELSWAVYDEVKSAAALTKKQLLKSRTMMNERLSLDVLGTGVGILNDDRVLHGGGALHVEILHATELSKPEAKGLMASKMPSSKMTPYVAVDCVGKTVKTSLSRGLNPVFNDHFYFTGVTVNDELTLRVNQPGKSAKGAGKTMGVVVIPLNGVIKAGSTMGSYALTGCKTGEITVAMKYRAETAYVAATEVALAFEEDHSKGEEELADDARESGSEEDEEDDEDEMATDEEGTPRTTPRPGKRTSLKDRRVVSSSDDDDD